MVLLSGTSVRHAPSDEYIIKTQLRILPEYELYHTFFGVPEKHDAFILAKIKTCIEKKYSIEKIKSYLNI